MEEMPSIVVSLSILGLLPVLSSHLVSIVGFYLEERGSCFLLQTQNSMGDITLDENYGIRKVPTVRRWL